MAGTSEIEWTDATWNPVRGCVKVSPGCKHCYAETFAERWRGIAGHAYEQGFEPRLVPEQLRWPLTKRKPLRIFVNSMSDLFGDFVPDDYIAQVFDVMRECSLGFERDVHTFQVLTKRASRMRSVARRLRFDGGALSGAGLTWVADTDDSPGWRLLGGNGCTGIRNVWLGVSVEDRKYGVPRIAELRETPAVVRFISVEPLLEDLGTLDLSGIDQVIVGAESGRGARPMNEDWVRSIRDQCLEQRVRFFYKQRLDARGHKVSLPVLDGKQWAEMPGARP